jgi:hypothetical protein
VTSHASHGPLHALSQQRPSVQWPLAHCSAFVHVSPAPSGGTHAQSLQTLPGAQSALEPQHTLHTPFAHL